MAWVMPLALGLLGVGFILETLLLIGLTGLVKDQARKFNLLLSNYKADLEMVLLHAHNFDEFLRLQEEARKQQEEAMKMAMANPEETVYIQ